MITARAPLRISFAGGGTDISSYYKKYGGLVINTTINKYVYAFIETTHAGLELNSLDLSIFETYDFNNLNIHSKLILHFSVYNYFVHNFNQGKNIPLRISTLSEAPIGSGLGSSSTIVVALVKAFVHFFNLDLDKHEIAEIAYKIERNDCKINGGKQDQYASAFGGINYIEFKKNQDVCLEPLSLGNSMKNELESGLLIYFSGVSRDSSEIIADQVNSISDTSLDALHELKNLTVLMRNALLNGDLDNFCNCLNLGWKTKKLTSKKITNSNIDSIISHGIKWGSKACKVSGAGGGGFIIFYVPVEKRISFIKEMKHFGGEFLTILFSDSGVVSWES